MDEEVIYDLAIIGGGPCGLTAALYALRAGKSVIIFEGDVFGGTLNIVKEIENYPAFKSISGKELASLMTEQVLALAPTVVKQFVKSVSGSDGEFMLITGAEEFYAKKVIYAGGLKRGTIPAATRFTGSGVSYCAVCDGFFYKGKTVAVVGNGYAAEEDAAYLTGLCKKVYIVGDATAEGAEQIKDTIINIKGTDNVEGIELKSGKTIDIDGLFIALGGSPASEIFEELLCDMEGDIKLKEGMLVEGVYIAGDAGGNMKQVVYACSTGAEAVDELFKLKKMQT